MVGLPSRNQPQVNYDPRYISTSAETARATPGGVPGIPSTTPVSQRNAPPPSFAELSRRLPELVDTPEEQLRYFSGWSRKDIPGYNTPAPAPVAPTPGTKGSSLPPPRTPDYYTYEVYDPAGRRVTGTKEQAFLDFSKSDLWNRFKQNELAASYMPEYGNSFFGGVTKKEVPIYGEKQPGAKNNVLPVIGKNYEYYDPYNRKFLVTDEYGNQQWTSGDEGAYEYGNKYLEWADKDQRLNNADFYLPYEEIIKTGETFNLPHVNQSGDYAKLPDVRYQEKALNPKVAADRENQFQYLLAMGHPAALKEQARREYFAEETRRQAAADELFLNSVRMQTAESNYILQNLLENPVADPTHGAEWQKAAQDFLDNTKPAYTSGFDYYGRFGADPTGGSKGIPLPNVNPNQSSILQGQKSTNGIPDRIWARMSQQERDAVTRMKTERDNITYAIRDPFSTFSYGLTDQDVYGADLTKKPVRGVTRGPGGVVFGGTGSSLGWRNGNPVPPDAPGAGLWVMGKDPNDPRILSWAFGAAMSNRGDRPEKGGEGGRRFDKYANLMRQNPDGTWNKVTDPKIAQSLLNDLDAYYRELAFRMDLPKRSFSIGSLFEAFIPALVGIATGNPYLAGLTAFGQSAAKGDILGMVTSVLGMGVNAYGGFGKILKNFGINPNTITNTTSTLTSIPKLNTWITKAVKDFLDPTKVGEYSMGLGGFAFKLSTEVISQMTDLEKIKLIKEPFYGYMYAGLTPQQRTELGLVPPDYSSQRGDYAQTLSRLKGFTYPYIGESSIANQIPGILSNYDANVRNYLGIEKLERPAYNIPNVVESYLADNTPLPSTTSSATARPSDPNKKFIDSGSLTVSPSTAWNFENTTPTPAARGGLMSLPSKYRPMRYRRVA